MRQVRQLWPLSTGCGRVAMQEERKASAQEWGENGWMEGSNGDLSMYRGDLRMLGGKTEGIERAQGW